MGFMSHLPAQRRKLYMHSAHAVIGVPSRSALFRPTTPSDADLVPWQRERSLCVSLVSGELSGDAVAAMRWFQRTLRAELRADCRCMFLDIAEGLPDFEDLDPVGCTVLLYQGITILRHREDWDLGLLAGGAALRHAQRRTKIALAPAARRHPLLRQVEPFLSESGLLSNPQVPADALCLLMGNDGAKDQPVASAREQDDRRVFHTSLGCPGDFQTPDFCRLLTNALHWATDES